MILKEGIGWTRNSDGGGQCLQCGNTYLNHRSIARHIKEHHLESGQTWTCPKCKIRMFYTRRHLQAHMDRVHNLKLPPSSLIPDQNLCATNT